MGKVSSMVWVGILAVLMGGCGLLGGGSDKPDAASTPAPAPAPAPKKAEAEPEPEPEQIVEPLPSAPDLIQSTNPEQRIREIEQSEGEQKDPFNVVSLPPIVELPEEPPEPPRNTARTPIRRPPGPRNPPGPRSGASALGNGEIQVQPATVEPIIFPTLPQMEPLPPIGRLAIALGPGALPPPEIATAVTVSGVMELGGELQAIVTAPDEPTLRVKVGDRLANKTVLVKRIEISKFDRPVVILEENGYEVARELGEKPSSEEKP